MRPSQLPEGLLRTLVREYDRDPDVRRDGKYISRLGRAAGLDPISGGAYFVSDLYEGLRLLEERGYIHLLGVGANMSAKLTSLGLAEGERILRPWYHKTWDWFKGDIRAVVVALITAVLGTFLTTLVLRVLGWN